MWWLWILKLIKFVGFGSGALGPIIDFIKKYWKIIVIVLFVVAFAWSYWNLSKENQKLKITLATAETTITAYIESEQKYQITINEQNQSILTYKDRSDEAKKRLATALQNARKRVEYLDRKLIELSQSGPENASCEATIEWMVNIKEDLKWEE